MFNKVVLVGNLTRDIEMRSTTNGMMIGATGIAVNRRYTDSSGEKREETCFIDISFFAKLAEIANLYLRKGSKVLIEGRLRQENWVDQNGNKRFRHSIVVENMEMLGSNQQNNQQEMDSMDLNNGYSGYNRTNQNTEKSYTPNKQQEAVKSAQTIDLDDEEDAEELPF